MAPNIMCLRKDAFLYAVTAGIILIPAILFFAQPAGSQEAETIHDPANLQSALTDLSEAYGQPITRVEQARAICNLEQYLADCADIGKKHDLYTPDEEKQVDTVLTELKGKVVEDLKQCQDEICLVEVANRLAKGLVAKSPTLAKQLDLTPQKVGEKKALVETAKEIGVRFEDCRSMDPDTASVELLRSCAKLAKHEKVQRYLPEETKQLVKINDTSLDLQDALKRGDYQCGDNTLDGCGNFCLNPAQATRAGGVSAIPPVCRQIAEKFFGKEGITELEKAYNQVTNAAEYYQKRAENVAFTTQDGRILTNPAEIGKYMEGEMKRGNVEAIEKGMDFMVTKGFVSPQDREFAVRMAKKVKEQGRELNFDECARNPALCNDFIPDDHREEFKAMEEVRRIMTDEMRSRGVPDPNLCESNPQYGESCVKGAQAALPKIEEIAKQFPPARFIVEEIKRKISFGQGGVDARRRVEDKFSRGGQELKIGDKTFRNFGEMDAFCRENGSLCLTEVARQGFIEKDYAANKYEHTYEVRFGPSGPPFGPGGFPGGGPYPGFVPPGVSGFPPPGQTPGFTAPGPGFGPPPGFNKEDALKQFQQWLDNPQGAPPIPSFIGPPGGPYPGGPGQYPPFGPTGYPPPGPGYPPYQQQFCPQFYPRPCPAGQYRQESRDDKGCFVLSECVSVNRGDNVVVGDKVPCKDYYRDPGSCNTNPSCSWQSFGVCRNRYCLVSVAPPPFCGPGQDPYDFRGCEVCTTGQVTQPPICPALPTVDTCPAGQRKVVTYSSKECGNYYGCEAVETTSQCPPNLQYWNGQGCVNSNIKCPVGQYWADNKCIAGPSDIKFPYFFPVGYTAANAEAARTYCELVRGSISWNEAVCPKFGVFPSPISVPPFPVPPPPGINFPYKFPNGRIVYTFEEAKAYCYANGPGSGQGIAGECETKFGVYYGGTTPPGPGACGTYYNKTSCTSSGCSWSRTDLFDGPYCYTPGGPVITDTYCRDLESLIPGCHTMPESPNARFNSGMTQYVITGTRDVKSCSTSPIPGCSGAGGGGAVGSCTQELISLLGSGCHSMGNAYFDGPMAKYVLPGTNVIKDCTTNYISSCTVGGGTQPPATGGQREQIWNSLGLRSWIRSDADPARIEQLKQSCANVPSGSNIWMPGSGNSSSLDFGIPDPVKCQRAASCIAGQYFDGNTCVTSGPTTTTPSSCDSQLISLLGTGCHQMYTDSSGNYIFCDGPMSKSAKRGDTVTTTGCTSPTGGPTPTPTSSTCPTTFAHDMGGYCMLNNDTSRCAEYSNASVESNYTSSVCTARTGTTTTCPSGQYWYVPSGGGAGYCKTTSTTDCPSGQYWYVPSGGGAGYCTSSTTTADDCATKYGTGWHTMESTSGNCYNSSMTEYRTVNGTLYQCSTTPASGCPSTTTTTCPSGQYWYVPSGGGTGYCKTTSTTDCPSGQYWNGTACVTSTTTSGCSTPATCFDSAICASSGWYWYNAGCWSSPQSTTSSCPSGYHTMGSYCMSDSNPANCQPTGGGAVYTCPGYTPPAVCGNAVCESNETSSTCPGDCGPPPAVCGNAICEGSETSASCPGDCPPPPPPPPPSGPVCGNATCESGLGETSSSCPGDCPPPPPPPSAFLSPRRCPSNHDWNGYYCTVRPQYTAHFFAQVRTSLSQIGGIVGSLFGW